jgi:molybdopterin biosynthesis enzyme MoaB
MAIKTGILCVPAYDEDAVTAVRRLLVSAAPGCVVLLEHRVPMQRHLLEEVLRRWADEDELDLIITVGGTLPAPGPSGREIVPDATLAVAERLLPGLPETMRALAQEEAPLAILDRGVAVIRGRTLILNLPAGAAAATLFLESVVAVIPTAVAGLQEDAPDFRIVDEEEMGESELEPMTTANTPITGKQALDTAEFAAFLARKR